MPGMLQLEQPWIITEKTCMVPVLFDLIQRWKAVRNRKKESVFIIIDEARHVLDFFAYILHVGFLFFISPLLKYSNGHLDARQRGAEFVGDIAKKAFLSGDKPGEARGHVVDGEAKLTEFVATILLHANRKMTFGDLPGCKGHL